MSASKFIAGLVVGAAAGAAMAVFLQTEKGKEFMNNVKDTAGKAGDNLKEKMQNLDDEFAALLKKGKQFVQDLESRVKSSTENL